MATRTLTVTMTFDPYDLNLQGDEWSYVIDQIDEVVKKINQNVDMPEVSYSQPEGQSEGI